MITLWSWDKKRRTMLRFIRPGDLFCLQLDDGRFAFGRIMAKSMVGHIAEIFDIFADEPVLTAEMVTSAVRLMPPVVLDSYSLFDRKSEGEWRILGHTEDYVPTGTEGVFFYYGIGSGCKLVDIFGAKTPVSEEEAYRYPPMSPNGDYTIKKQIAQAELGRR